MGREQIKSAVRFPSTQWSQVEHAGHLSDERRPEALAALLERYLPALRAHLVLAKQLSPDCADDLLQGFVVDKLIEQNLFGQAKQAKGRFRSFLLGALNHYVLTQWRRRSAQKRSPGQPVFDIADHPEVSAADPEPSWQFALIWAREIIDQALRRMDEHCTRTGQGDLWRVFEERILGPAARNTPPPTHRDIAEGLQIDSPKRASNLLVTAKRLFSRTLRRVVGEYVNDEREIGQEIKDLMRILSSHR